MTETRTPTEAPSSRQLQQHRRIKRGIFASYIHQLSERHNEAPAAADAVVEQAEEQAA